MEENKLNIENGTTLDVPQPTFCCFTLTDDCLLRCKMCQKWKEDIFIRTGQEKVTLDDWKKCAQSLKEFAPGDLTINFGGGEVTLIGWLFDLVKFCHELGFKTNIATNAVLVDEKMAKKIADSCLDYINISLDSLLEGIHDDLRGVNGVYKKALHAIELIREYSPHTKIGLCSVIMQPTLDGMVDLVKWVQANEKVDMISLMVLMQPNNTQPVDVWWQDKEFSSLWPKDLVKIEKILDELIELKKKGYKICNEVEHIEAFKTYFKAPDMYVKKSTCNIERAVHVTSVGDMFMCFRHDKLGNISDQTLKDMWQSPKADQIRQKIRGCRENCHFLLNCKFEA